MDSTKLGFLIDFNSNGIGGIAMVWEVVHRPPSAICAAAAHGKTVDVQRLLEGGQGYLAREKLPPP